MALRSLPIGPGSRPDARHETVYDAARGGWYPPAEPTEPTEPSGADRPVVRSGGRSHG